MAKLNDTSKGLLGESSEKIGTYQEATGGGTPLKKGEKLKDHPEAERVMQPRDENGQFTYNSVNGKGLKYGPSRGTTVPPFLRGIELTFCQPGTKLKLEGEGGMKIKIMTIDMTVEEIVHRCKEYIESEEGFAGMGEGSSITKKGRKSKEEKEAKAGQAGYVDPKTLSQGTQKEMADATAKYAKENSADKEPVNPLVTNAPFTKNGYQVQTDTLNPDGTTTKNTQMRYNQWFQKNNQKPATQPTPQTNAQPTQQPQPNKTPVTPSGAPAPQQAQKPTGQSIKSGLAGIFGKKASSTPTQNDDGDQNKFAGLDASLFDNLFN